MSFGNINILTPRNYKMNLNRKLQTKYKEIQVIQNERDNFNVCDEKPNKTIVKTLK